MRDSKGLAAHLVLIAGQVLPQVFRILAVEQRERRGSAGLVSAVAEHDDAMEVVSGRCGAPLETGEGREAAGLVKAVGGLDEALPNGACYLRISEPALPGRGVLQDRLEGFETPLLTRVEPFMQPLAVGIREQDRIRFPDHRREPDVLGVVGDHEKIERPDQLHRLTGVRDDFFPAGEAIGIFHAQRGSYEARVGRKLGVEVSIASVDPVRIGPAGVARVNFLLREIFGGDRKLGEGREGGASADRKSAGGQDEE